MSSTSTKLDARAVADYFLIHVDEEAGDNLTNLKLQKLVYYAQGVHLALTGQPLFDDEICAWQLGPAIPTLYRQFSQTGGEPIPRPEGFDPDQYSVEVCETLDEVQQVFGQFSASRLRFMTCSEPPYRDVAITEVISHSSLRAYFLTRLIDEPE